MSAVADAGPLIALAKINGLSALFDLHPNILICPAVQSEAFTVGLTLGAEGAIRLQNEYQAGRFQWRAPAAAGVARTRTAWAWGD